MIVAEEFSGAVATATFVISEDPHPAANKPVANKHRLSTGFIIYYVAANTRRLKLKSPGAWKSNFALFTQTHVSGSIATKPVIPSTATCDF